MAPPKARLYYIAVENRMPEHPKIEALSDGAFRLLVTLWCWCDRNESDGRVPAVTWERRGTAKARRELLEARMVDRAGLDYQMHDYLDYQRSAEEINALRRTRAEAGSRGGKATALARANGAALATANGQQNGSKLSSKFVAETEEEEETELRTTDRGDRYVTLPAPRATNPPICSTHPLGDGGTACGGCARVRKWWEDAEAEGAALRRREAEQRKTAAVFAESAAARASAVPRPKETKP